MDKLSIEDIKIPSNEEWDLIWKNCDNASYYHSREWAEIWNTYSKGKIYPCPKLVQFSDGKKALIPMSVQYDFKGLVKTHISSPIGTLGGWFTEDRLTYTHAKMIVDYMLKEFTNLLWFTNPYDELVRKLELPAFEQDETYALDLTQGFDVAYAKWNKSQRHKVKQAKKAGVSIRLANSSEDWDAYFEIYEDTLRRWGKKATSKYSKGLFEELFRRKSPAIKLWLAIYEDKIVAGDMTFYSKNLASGWHAAALEKYLKMKVVNLLIYEILQDACDNGYSWLDFGPCGGHESVRAFKKRFGTEELPFSIINSQGSLKKMLSRVIQLI